MIKTLAVTLLTTVTMIGAAQADDEMDAYTTCWADVAGRGTENAVIEADTYLLQNAVASASKECMSLALEAVKTNGLENVKAMADYMEVQFYNGHLREKGVQIAAAEPEKKIEKISGHKASASWMMYNARVGYLCRLPLDSEPMRQLVSTNRLELAKQKTGCVIVEQPIEVEEIRRWGDTMEVRYVNTSGQMVEAYTSARTFRTKSEWNQLGIE